MASLNIGGRTDDDLCTTKKPQNRLRDVASHRAGQPLTGDETSAQGLLCKDNKPALLHWISPSALELGRCASALTMAKEISEAAARAEMG
jgi:hypothetical protein